MARTIRAFNEEIGSPSKKDPSANGAGKSCAKRFWVTPESAVRRAHAAAARDLG
jgi:hypothetical protein